MITINSNYFKRVERGRTNLMWKAKDGQKVSIGKMKTGHIVSLIKCFTGQSNNYHFKDKFYYGVSKEVWMEELGKELKWRATRR